VIEKIDEWKMHRLQLTINHRSVQQICDVVVAKLGGKKQIMGTRSSLNKSCLLWVYDKKLICIKNTSS
jgi:DNA helicase II / ATP-dependent DNA helicase PcrA